MTTHLDHQTELDFVADSAVRAPQTRRSECSTNQQAEVPFRAGADYYDTVLWRIWSRRPDASDAAYVLGLIGCARRVGVSTLATNLAIRAADHKLGPVLLIDANLRSPELHKLMLGEIGGGLANMLIGEATLDACVRTTPVTGLDVLPLGAPAGSEGRRIDPAQIDATVDQVRERYTFAICDLPAAPDLSQTLVLARALDAVFLVVRSARDRRRSAQQTVHDLTADAVPLSGIVVTGQHGIPHWLDRLI